MELLITAAMFSEIRLLTEKMTLCAAEQDKISQYRYRNLNIDVLISGVGMVNTTYHLGRLFQKKKYDLVLNAGICGAFESTIQVGEVVEITEEIFSELGAENQDEFLTMFDLGLMDPEDPPYKNGKLINETSLGKENLTKYNKVRGITANTVHGNKEAIQKTRERFHPDVESMEGAAFFYCCLIEDVPFHQIRSISNYVKERDKSKWNVNLALKNLNAALLDFLKTVAV